MAAASMPQQWRQHAGIGSLLLFPSGVCARPAAGAKVVAVTAAAIRDRRNTLPAPKHAPARSVRRTSEAAKPTYLRRQRAKQQADQQPGGGRGLTE